MAMIWVLQYIFKGIVHQFFKSLRCFISGAASQKFMRYESKPHVLLVETPCGAASRNPWGQNSGPILVNNPFKIVFTFGGAKLQTMMMNGDD